MRVTMAAALVCLSTVGVATTHDARAAIRKDTTIAAQSLGSALQQLAREREIQFVYRSELVGQRQTSGAVGELTFEEALTELLRGTGLIYQYLDERAVTITPIKSNTSDAHGAAADSGSPAVGGWERFRLAQLDTTVARSGGENTEARGALEEVIVTAQKREERLQDVPVSIATVSGESLVKSNLLRLQDYYVKLPGLSYQTSSYGGNVLAVRGLVTSNLGAPTVGVIVDDAPYPPVTGGVAPEIDPGELARVELLRGPQGTLYGSSSIGGLLKFVTRDPSTDEFSGRVQTGLSTVAEGGSLGYQVRGSVNLPISETWVVTASGYTRRDPGVIDNVRTGQNDVDTVDVYGGRVAALWRPSDDLSLKLSATLQDRSADGLNANGSLTGPQPGRFEQNRVPGTEAYDKSFQLYSATLNADLGRAELTSLTAYFLRKDTTSLDGTYLYSPSVQNFFPGLSSANLMNLYDTEQFTQELRLSIPVGERIDWLVGAFYTHGEGDNYQRIWAVNSASGERVGLLRQNAIPSASDERALFTNVTFRFNDRFDVQIGGRQSRTRSHVTLTQTGAQVIGSTPTTYQEGNAFTYLFTPRFKLSPDMMIYARLASGFRPGGSNTNSGDTTSIPRDIKPDKTKNYELGFKSSLFDRAVTFDAALYYIEWVDIQLGLTHPTSFQTYTGNVGRASSQGVELSVQSRPWTGFTLAASASWNEAELAEDFPSTSSLRGRSGDRLPFGAKYSGTLSAEQSFLLGAETTGNVGAAISYIGDRLGGFTGTGIRVAFPSYTQIDLTAGVERKDWSAALAVNNLTNRHGLLYGGPGSVPPYGFIYTYPRLISLSVTKNF
jgi:iron complex outermembrane recepter protein